MMADVGQFSAASRTLSSLANGSPTTTAIPTSSRSKTSGAQYEQLPEPMHTSRLMLIRMAMCVVALSLRNPSQEGSKTRGSPSACKTVVRDAPMDLFEGDPQLETGQVGAQAEVVGSTKGHVAIGRPVKVHHRGPEHLFVVIGRAEDHRCPVARLQCNAAEHHLLGEDAWDGHNRGGSSEKLFDGGRHATWVINDLLAVVRVLGQEDDHAVECGSDGVEATKEQ